MSDATLRLVERLRQRLQKTKRRIYLTRLTYGGVVTAGLSAAVLLLVLLAEAYFWFPVPGRTALLLVLGAVLAGLAVYYLGVPFLRITGLTEEMLARQVGSRYPAVQDRLINILHLAKDRGSISDPNLRDEAIQDLDKDVHEVSFEQMASFGQTRKALRWAALPFLGLLTLGLTLPDTLGSAATRLFSPGTAFERPAPFAWHLSPGDSTIVRGEPLNIAATARGRRLPQQATLELQYDEQTAVETVELTADSTHRFYHQRSNIRQTLRYRLQAGRVTSRWHTIRVVNRPFVRRLQLSLTPPAYTGLPQRTLAPNVGDVGALPGTKVQLTITPDGSPLKSALLAFSNGTTDTLTLNNGHREGIFTVTEDLTYRVKLQNPTGITNKNPIEYTVQTVSDGPPSAELQAPETVSDIDQSGTKSLQTHITDDYGFSRMRLYYRLAESRFDQPMDEFAFIELPLEQPTLLDQSLAYTWQLAATSELDPVRGDVIEYYIKVWDNNAVAGYQTAKTATQVLRFPSLAQQYNQLNEKQQSAQSAFKALQEESNEIHKEFEALRSEIRRQQKGDWQNQQRVKQLQERQQQMEERAEKLSQDVKSITEQMDKQSLVDEETLQMYQELQQVVEEIKSPKLQQALQDLQKSMQNLDLKSMQKALENFKFSENQYRERLKRTLDLFKKLRAQQELDEVTRRTQQLAEQQKKLGEQTEDLLNKQQPNENKASQTPEEPEASEQQNLQDDAPSPEEGSNAQQSKEPRDGQKNSSSANRQSSTNADSSAAQTKRMAQQQEQASQEMKAIQKRMEELRKQMEELKQSPQQSLKELQQKMSQQNLPKQMQQNSQQLRRQELQKARQGQQSMQQQLDQLSKQFSQMKQSMRGQQLQINIAGLRQALSNVLHLSDQQETLRHRLNDLPPDSPVLRELTQQQKSFSEGLTTVTDSLQALASEIPQMSRHIQQRAGDGLRAMSQSVDRLTGRRLPEAASQQKEAMNHLNKLAVDLSNLLEKLQNMQQSGGGSPSMQQMLEQMQKMGQQQQQVNQQIQQLLNDIQGSRLTQSQKKRLDQIRQQQQAIQQQLKKLSQNSEAQNKLLGDLNKIAEQMEETVQELRQESVTRKMVERQQQILSRMLEAQKSLQTRGKEKQRRSQSGEEVVRESPEQLPSSEPTQQLQRELLRALESGYASDYEELIKRYFQELQKQSSDGN